MSKLLGIVCSSTGRVEQHVLQAASCCGDIVGFACLCLQWVLMCNAILPSLTSAALCAAVPCATTRLCSNLVHSFKHAFRPALRHVPDSLDSPMVPSSPAAPTTTHITLHLRQLLQGAVGEPDCMEVDEPEASCSTGPWPPTGTHLGHLPSHLVSCCA